MALLSAVCICTTATSRRPSLCSNGAWSSARMRTSHSSPLCRCRIRRGVYPGRARRGSPATPGAGDGASDCDRHDGGLVRSGPLVWAKPRCWPAVWRRRYDLAQRRFDSPVPTRNGATRRGFYGSLATLLHGAILRRSSRPKPLPGGPRPGQRTGHAPTPGPLPPRSRHPVRPGGTAQQARAALSTAIALYRAMAMTFWLPQAEAALAHVGAALEP